MLVRISEKGMNVLDNRALATKIIDAIIKSKDSLISGNSVKVEGEDISVKMVTSLKDDNPQKKDK